MGWLQNYTMSTRGPFCSVCLYLLSNSCTTGFRLLDLRSTASIKQPEGESKSKIRYSTAPTQQGTLGGGHSFSFHVDVDVCHNAQGMENTS